MSGAGKSTALKILEDAGYFCVDNLPIPLLVKFVELFMDPDPKVDKVALGIDIRGKESFDQLEANLGQLLERKIQTEILFLDAKDNVLVKRYQETRRTHPLAADGRLDLAIAEERRRLEFLKIRISSIPGIF